MVAVIALLLALTGTWLWIGLAAGPWHVLQGLRGAQSDLEHAQKAISAGKLKDARYFTVDAVASVRSAKSAYYDGGALLDLAGAVPRISSALQEVPHLLDAAHYSVKAAKGTLKIVHGALKGRGKIIAPDPNQKKGSIIRLDKVREVRGEIEDVRGNVQAAGGALRAINPDNLSHSFRHQVEDGIAKAAKTSALLAKADAGFKLLPDILGGNGRRTYILAFQNPDEERGTGGAMLQYAVMDFDQGAPHMVRKTSTVYKVDKNRQPLTVPLPRSAWYVRAITDAQRFGNSNWSPDWPLSAKLMIDYGHASSAPFPQRVDGMIGVDPTAAQEMMPGVGAFQSPKAKLRMTADNLVNFLLFKAYASYPISAQRRYVLHDVVQGFYEGMFDPRRPSDMVKGAGKALAAKHIQIWMRDPKEEAFIRRMGWDGGIAPARSSDYLDIVEQNIGGNKLDYFESRSFSLDVRMSGTGTRDTATTTIANPVVLPQPRWAMGDSGPFHHPMLNFYVPGHASLESADGPPVATTADPVAQAVRLATSPPGLAWGTGSPPEHTEKGKKVWSGTLDIPPQQDGTMSLTYQVPGVVHDRNGRKKYRLVLQHQPGVHPPAMDVTLHLPATARDVSAPGFQAKGQTLTWSGSLDADKTITVSWR